MASFSEEDVLAVIESYLGGKDFRLVEFAYEPFTEVLGFHGSHALLKAEVEVDGAREKTSFFVKSATKSKEVFERYFAKIRCFYKEHVMMTTVLKELQRVVRPKLTSECYLSKLDEFIVLENLNPAGYEVSRKEDMDLDHAKCSLRAFANLHAASILYEETTGAAIGEKFGEVVFETFFVDTPPGDDEGLVLSMHTGAKDLADAYFKDVPDKDAVLDYVRKTSVEMVKPSTEYRNVICQGDPWGNNVLYRYDDEGRPLESCLVDFQASRYAPPALEVVQFLYLASSSEFRKRNKRFLKDYYYECLAGALSAGGVDPEAVLSRETFERSCREYKKFGVAAQVYYAYLTRLPPQYLLAAAASSESFLGLMIGCDSRHARVAFHDNYAYRQQFSEALVDAVRAYKDSRS